jgi:hypothetical protein
MVGLKDNPAFERLELAQMSPHFTGSPIAIGLPDLSGEIGSTVNDSGCDQLSCESAK